MSNTTPYLLIRCEHIIELKSDQLQCPREAKGRTSDGRNACGFHISSERRRLANANTCTQCGAEGKDHRVRFGKRQQPCRDCERAKAREYAKAKRDGTYVLRKSVDRGTLICKHCKRDGQDFYLRRNGAPMQPCKECTKEEKRQIYRETQGAEYKRRRDNRTLMTRYGFTMAERDAMLEQQNGCCAICGEKPKETTARSKLNVDHCHVTGKVRELLCNRCNTAVGHIESALFPAFLAYIEKHKKLMALTEAG